MDNLTKECENSDSLIFQPIDHAKEIITESMTTYNQALAYTHWKYNPESNINGKSHWHCVQRISDFLIVMDKCLSLDHTVNLPYFCPNFDDYIDAAQNLASITKGLLDVTSCDDPDFNTKGIIEFIGYFKNDFRDGWHLYKVRRKSSSLINRLTIHKFISEISDDDFYNDINNDIVLDELTKKCHIRSNMYRNKSDDSFEQIVRLYTRNELNTKITEIIIDKYIDVLGSLDNINDVVILNYNKETTYFDDNDIEGIKTFYPATRDGIIKTIRDDVKVRDDSNLGNMSGKEFQIPKLFIINPLTLKRNCPTIEFLVIEAATKPKPRSYSSKRYARDKYIGTQITGIYREEAEPGYYYPANLNFDTLQLVPEWSNDDFSTVYYIKKIFGKQLSHTESNDKRKILNIILDAAADFYNEFGMDINKYEYYYQWAYSAEEAYDKFIAKQINGRNIIEFLAINIASHRFNLYYNDLFSGPKKEKVSKAEYSDAVDILVDMLYKTIKESMKNAEKAMEEAKSNEVFATNTKDANMEFRVDI